VGAGGVERSLGISEATELGWPGPAAAEKVKAKGFW